MPLNSRVSTKETHCCIGCFDQEDDCALQLQWWLQHFPQHAMTNTDRFDLLVAARTLPNALIVLIEWADARWEHNQGKAETLRWRAAKLALLLTWYAVHHSTEELEQLLTPLTAALLGLDGDCVSCALDLNDEWCDVA